MGRDQSVAATVDHERRYAKAAEALPSSLHGFEQFRTQAGRGAGLDERIGEVSLAHGRIARELLARDRIGQDRRRRQAAQDRGEGALPAGDARVQRHGAQDEQVRGRPVGAGVCQGDERAHRVSEQNQRYSRLAYGGDPDRQVEIVVPGANVDAPATREPVAANVERMDVDPRLGHEPSGSLVAAAVLTDAVDEQDGRPRTARRRPMPQVQRRSVDARRGRTGSGHVLG